METEAKIFIRNQLNPGDLGQIAALHGRIYAEEHNFGLGFEAYVMDSLLEFYRQYDANRDKVWVVESEGKMVGFLLLMHRQDEQAQLRYFILEKPYRGMGLGKKLMEEWMEFYKEKGYRGAYLYTTSGLDPAISLYERYGFKKVSQMKSRNFGVHLLEMLYRLYPS
ncbi:GNAT family N-acetyltransferase [Algoriphagus sp. NBT04N3]|jgi:ribosomal protein S18 acetylase RimI-like enzyme|uniref:GNAT family N-acetyltransferase n=1 Tax=Algoriphagus sp. NBT04N3 TaxID=2705473 RepID=UPI001C6390C1|nr:GNAT family N-acetyltransferase [Algoriphagus sp. NBT04N3]QYH40089.1 GNAT family N-acetyltransferase [Algoriphagus sp. NBT04N3]